MLPFYLTTLQLDCNVLLIPIKAEIHLVDKKDKQPKEQDKKAVIHSAIEIFHLYPLIDFDHKCYFLLSVLQNIARNYPNPLQNLKKRKNIFKTKTDVIKTRVKLTCIKH